MTDLANNNPLFYNSALLFSQESMEKLKNVKIALAGLGGIGSITLEMLVRSGIENFKIADYDKYSKENLNRQLFATVDTIGKNKALVAKERMLKINPSCNIEVFKDGVTYKNAHDFCKDSDIILVLPDSEAIKVLIHKIAKKNKTPCIMASRDSLENASRWFIRAKLWDYKNENTVSFAKTNHPELDKFEIEELNQDILDKYDEKIKIKKMNLFKEKALKGADLFKSISKKDLIERIENTPDYYNRHVCSVIANSAGCFAAVSAIKYILREKCEYLGIDLW